MNLVVHLLLCLLNSMLIPFRLVLLQNRCSLFRLPLCLNPIDHLYRHYLLCLHRQRCLHRYLLHLHLHLRRHLSDPYRPLPVFLVNWLSPCSC